MSSTSAPHISNHVTYKRTVARPPALTATIPKILWILDNKSLLNRPPIERSCEKDYRLNINIILIHIEIRFVTTYLNKNIKISGTFAEFEIYL